MSTCGYTCPQCGGTGFTEEGDICDWCAEAEPGTGTTDEPEDEPENPA